MNSVSETVEHVLGRSTREAHSTVFNVSPFFCRVHEHGYSFKSDIMHCGVFELHHWGVVWIFYVAMADECLSHTHSSGRSEVLEGVVCPHRLTSPRCMTLNLVNGKLR